MRYKSLALEQIFKIESLFSKLKMEYNRNLDIEETLEYINDYLENLRNLINIEHDSFEQEFSK